MTQVFRRRALSIATFNVQGMSSHRRPVMTKLECLVRLCEAHNIDALSIQEHKILPDSTDTTFQIPCGSWTFIYSPAEKATGDRTVVGGVGWLLAPRVANAIRSTSTPSPRILVVTLNMRRASPIHLTACYAPTAPSSTERQLFWTTLDKTLLHHSRYLLAGDFNSVLSHGDDGPWGAPTSITTTHARDEMVDFIKAHDLRASSTWYNLPHFTTFTAPTSLHGITRRTVLDYILLPKWVKQHEVYATYNPIPSDHKPVVVRIALPRPPPPPRRPLYTGPQEDQETARTTLVGKFKELFPDQPTSITYEGFAKALLKSAEETLPKLTPYRRLKPSQSLTCRMTSATLVTSKHP